MALAIASSDKTQVIFSSNCSFIVSNDPQQHEWRQLSSLLSSSFNQLLLKFTLSQSLENLRQLLLSTASSFLTRPTVPRLVPHWTDLWLRSRPPTRPRLPCGLGQQLSPWSHWILPPYTSLLIICCVVRAYRAVMRNLSFFKLKYSYNEYQHIFLYNKYL